MAKAESATSTTVFYDEYLAVMDMTAEFYLSTVERIFKDREIARNEFMVDGHKVDIGKITRVAVKIVEGEKDDISAPGQCLAALDLLTGLSDMQKASHVEPGAGHYGIFRRQVVAQQYPPAGDGIHGHAFRRWWWRASSEGRGLKRINRKPPPNGGGFAFHGSGCLRLIPKLLRSDPAGFRRLQAGHATVQIRIWPALFDRN